MKLLTSRDYTKTVTQIVEVVEQLEPMDRGEELVEQELSDQDLHTLYSAGRSQTLGGDPKKARKETSYRMELGFYLSETGRKGTPHTPQAWSMLRNPGLGQT